LVEAFFEFKVLTMGVAIFLIGTVILPRRGATASRAPTTRALEGACIRLGPGSPDSLLERSTFPGPSAVRLDSHIRQTFHLSDQETVDVVVGSGTLTDVLWAAIIVRGCVWWGGARDIEELKVSDTAIPGWNAAFDSTNARVAVGDASAARRLAIAWLAFATGRPLAPSTAAMERVETFATGSMSAGLGEWRADQTTAVYRVDGRWVVDGRWEGGAGPYSFEVIVSNHGRIESGLLRPDH
jgi:hypothetical protein